MISFTTSTLVALMMFMLSSSFDLMAKTISLATGQTKAPYINCDRKTGYQFELVEKVLALSEHSAKFVSTKYYRNEKLLLNSSLDGLLNVRSGAVHPGSYLSKTYITFYNVAVSLRANNIKVESVDNLANFDVVSFPKAKKYLGKEYARTVEQSPLYAEVDRLSSELTLIIAGRAEVLVMDNYIFKVLIQEQGLNIDDFNIEPIFEPVNVHILFKEQAIQKDFDRELTRFRQS